MESRPFFRTKLMSHILSKWNESQGNTLVVITELKYNMYVCRLISFTNFNA